MNDDTGQIKTKYDENLQEMPGEVQDFMWSDLYDTIINSIQEAFLLKNDQKEKVRLAGYQLLLGNKTMEDVGNELIQSGITADVVAKILYAIHSEIMTRAENITEFYSEDKNTGPVPIPSVTTTPQTAAPLTGLQSRLTQSNMIMPVKRDLSPDATPASASAVPTKPAIDPYRELPEK